MKLHTLVPAKLRQKNQVTLPGSVVEALGVHQGDEIEFSVSGRTITISPRHPSEDWVTQEVAEEIEAAMQEVPESFSSLDELMQDLDD